jgi:TonB family protein
MIASWMLYALLIGTLVSFAALGAHRVAAALGKPTRFVWAAAMIVSLAWPAVMLVVRLRPDPTQAAVTVLPFTIDVQQASVRAAGPVGSDRAARVDAALVVAWSLAAGLLLLRLARSIARLRARRTGWPTATVDGLDVRLTDRVGPAVIGLRHMELVLPEWILELDAPLRELVLKHEAEHREARDPYLLFGSAVAVALMPWNPALWWHAKRLRLAVETDCDSRVLTAIPKPERYGMLLLTIAQRRSAVPLFAPMLSEPTTDLERRIIAMRSRRRFTRITVLAGALAAVGAIAVACGVRSPDAVTGPKPSAPREVQASQNNVYFEFQVEKPVQARDSGPSPRYPDMLRTANVEGEVLAQFVVNPDGKADLSTFKVLKSSHELFTSSVVKALPNMTFSPALVGGRPVRQLVQMPFQFNLSKTAAARAPNTQRDTALRGVPATRRTLRPNEVLKLEPVMVTANDGSGTLKPSLREVVVRDTARTAPAAAATKAPNPPGTFYEFQIEKHVQPVAGNPSPRYPDMLRTAKVEGEVLAQFVVDTFGRADMNTFKVLRSTHDLFTESVRVSLPNMRFEPAQVDGRKVKQLLQMPFNFNLSK